jgi:hypothetical protein
VLLLFTTFIPAGLTETNLAGLLIGTNKFGSFPLLQYMPLFLLGLYFAEYKIYFDIKLLIGSIICTTIPVSIYVFTQQLPTRFPPSLLWVISPMFFIYCYFLASRHIRSNMVEFIGKNVLFYLLVSNIIMFSFKGGINFSLYPDPMALKSLLTACLLIVLVTYLAKLPVKQ